MTHNEISIVSLYANPLGPQHIDYINGAYNTASRVVAIVNNDIQLRQKGSIMFYPENIRVKIVDSLKNVWKTILSVDKDDSVVKTLSIIRNFFPKTKMAFCNGGDRTEDKANKKEIEFCKSNNILSLYGIGGINKKYSSSKFIENAVIQYIDKNFL